MFSRLVALVLLAPVVVLAAPETVKFQVTGLFMPEREADLREVVGQIPGIKLVDVDFKKAEATFEIDRAVAFAGAKPEQVLQRFDERLRSVSYSTFGLKAPRTTPLEKLQAIEIKVAGLDCKACSLVAYEAVYKLDGVERATASFREGRVTAHIDPTKTDRARLEEALKKRGVQVTGP